MRHPFNAQCECKHCVKEGKRRLYERGTYQIRKQQNRIARVLKASREEQSARYLDCGPQAWDDRD